ncbi:MAG: helix-turn-helix domain-containing protein [Phycisphaerae bacterium]|nr:helix-turn-helix domain-containing protein [Phycisphaerae bacterium]
MAKPFYSLEEVTSLLGKSQADVTALVRSGALREFRDSGKVFFKKEDVDKLKAKGGGAAKAPSPGDSAEITLDAVEDENRSDDSLPSLVDTSGGTSIIGLADIDEEPPKPAPKAAPGKPAAAPPKPAGKGKSDTAVPIAGVRVLDDDDLELDADPLAKTQVTASPVSAASDQVALNEGTSSGSGLLDLTREADDTSLGAELLDEIYPGQDDVAPTAGGTGAAMPAPVAKTPTKASAPPKKGAAPAKPAPAPTRAPAYEEQAEEEDVVASGPVMTQQAPPRVVSGADASDPLFASMHIWSLIYLSVCGAVAAAVSQGFVPDFALWLTNNFLWFILGSFGGLGLLVLIGWLIGRSGSGRRA